MDAEASTWQIQGPGPRNISSRKQSRTVHSRASQPRTGRNSNACSSGTNASTDIYLPLSSNKTDDALSAINLGKRVLILMRGPPGSGKSTCARNFMKHHEDDGIILSTDEYFLTSNNEYSWDVSSIGDAHNFNRQRALQAMENRMTPVVIDNTNICAWEMRPYVIMGVTHSYEIYFIQPDVPWIFKPTELFRRNTHNVPLEKIRHMCDVYERNISLASFNLERIFGKKLKYSYRSKNRPTGSTTAVSSLNKSSIDIERVQGSTIRNSVDPSLSELDANSSDITKVSFAQQSKPSLEEWEGENSSQKTWEDSQVQSTPMPCKTDAADRLLPSSVSLNWKALATDILLDTTSQSCGNVSQSTSRNSMPARDCSTQTWSPDSDDSHVFFSLSHSNVFTNEPACNYFTQSIQCSLAGNEASEPACVPQQTLFDDAADSLQKRYGHVLRPLQEMFPTISEDDVLEMLESCNGNLNFASQVLAESLYESGCPVPQSTTATGSSAVSAQKESDSGVDEVPESWEDVLKNSLSDVTETHDSDEEQTLEESSVVAEERIADAGVEFVDFEMSQESVINLIRTLNGPDESLDLPSTSNGLTVSAPKDLLYALLHCVFSSMIESNRKEQISSSSKTKKRRSPKKTANNELLAAYNRGTHASNKTWSARYHALYGTSKSAGSAPNMRDIIEEQQVIALAEQHSRSISGCADSDISRKIQRTRLSEVFPNIDASTLDSLFEACGYQFESAAENVMHIFPAQVPRIVASVNAPFPSDDTPSVSSDHITSPMESPVELRRKANDLRAKQRDLYEKANNSKDKMAASYYYSEATALGRQAKEADALAADGLLSVQSDTNCLDLHLLTHSEALQAVTQFLNERQALLASGGAVKIVTGVGQHSEIPGFSKLRAAVSKLFKQGTYSQNYQCREVNAGMFQIEMTSRARKLNGS